MKKMKMCRVMLAVCFLCFSFLSSGVYTRAQSVYTSGSEYQAASTTKKLKFKKKVKKLQAGSSYKFKVNKKNAKWYVSNKSLATINKKTGKLKAKKCGTVKITCKVKKEKVTCKVKITPIAVIGIDPGHQVRGDYGKEPNGPGSSVLKTKVAGGTCGVVTKKPEYQLTLEVGLKLKAELENRGYQVVMTRTTNEVNISNKQRAEALNKCNIAIRLHADGSSSSAASGASGLYPSAGNPYIGHLSPDCGHVTRLLLEHYCAKTGIRNRGLSLRDDLTGTNWSTVPTALIEMGFMTNPGDDSYMSNENNQNVMASALADGVDAVYGR